MKIGNVGTFVKLLFFMVISLTMANAFAGPGRTTYQAKIIKPNGYPLESSSVSFQFTILDPLGSCILYSESYNNINMATTGGLVSFSLGAGLKSFPLNATTFEQVFSNSAPSLLCAAGGPASYSPLATDTRKVVMQFNDGGGWQTLPAMNINAVPYAMFANDSQKLEGLSASDFVRVTTLPTCSSSQALHFNGGGFSCVALSSGSSGPVSYTVTANDVTTALGFTPTPAVSYTAVTSTVTNLSTSVTAIASAVASLSASALDIISDSRIINQAGVVSGTQYTKVTVDGKGRVISGSQITASEINSTLAMPSCGVNQYLTFNGSSYSCAADSGASGTITTISTTGALSATAGSNPTLSLNYSSDFTLSSNALALMTTGVAPGTYVKMTVDSKGRVVSSSALTISDITSALGYAPVSGSTLSSYVVRSNNLSDLTDFAAARNNLGLGGFATQSSLDLGSASATGIISDARLADQSGISSGTSYTKIYVDGKGRVVSGTTLSFSDVTTALGYTPTQSGSAISSQWITSGSVISYSNGFVGIGTTAPATDLEIKGAVAGLTLNRSVNSAIAPDIYLQKERGAGLPVLANDGLGHISFRGLTSATTYTRGARISSFVTSAPGQGLLGADLRFYTNNAGSDSTERIRVTASGSVGVGTFVPGSELEVSGTVRADQICDRNGNNCHVISSGWATGSSSSTGSVSITATAPLQVTGTSATAQLSLMTSGSVSGQTLRFDGANWQRGKLLYTDLVNSTAASPWPVSSCSAGQAIIWSSATDSFVCSSIQISAAQLPQANLSSSASGGVTGILPVANGGTGQTSFTANTFLLGNGSSAVNAFAMGASGAVLRSNGAGTQPSWTTLDTLLQAVNNSMVSNWPDALFCNDGSEFSVLHIDTRELATNRIWYSKASASHNIQFVATTGAYASNTGFTGNSVCINKSITTLMAEGRYFNVAKGPVGQWLSNGTTNYYNAGSVVVGAASAATSAAFEVSSTTKGFLPPRLSTAQRDAIASAANGLMIYNSTTLKYQFYDGSSWTDLGSGVAGSSSGTGTISSRQYFTANGTFTVPAGITRIRVSVAGGGGGGGDYTSTNGGDGGSSSFGGTIIGAGGLGGARGDYGLDRNGNLHGGGSGGNITIIGGGSAGGPGRPTWQSNSDPIDATGQTGGHGGLTISDINVTPGASFAVVIGGGGTATGGSPGASGYVIVEWGGGGGSGITTIDLGSASATGTLSAARLPAFSGDLSSSAGSSTLTLSNTGVTPGTYDRVTVDAKGRVTSGSSMSASDITTALGYTPTNIVSGTLGSAVAWVSFNSAGTITSSFNILSVSKTATGRFTVNFRYSLPDNTYAVFSGGVNTGASDGSWISVDNTSGGTGKSVSGVRIISYNSVGSLQDYPESYVVIYHGNGTAPLAYGFSETGAHIYRTSGNVGIGTSNPTRLLHIAGNAGSPTPGIAIEHTGAGGRSYALLSTGALNNQGDGKFLFYDLTSSTTRMAIDPTGYVGIGTASPTAQLEVSGTIRADRICDRSGNNCQTISAGWASTSGTASGSGSALGVVGYAQRNDTGVLTFTGTIPADNSIPQISEGSELLAVTVTVPEASDYLYFNLDHFHYGETANHSDLFTVSLFRDGQAGTDALAAHAEEGEYTNNQGALKTTLRVPAPAAGTYTYRIRAGFAGGNFYFNRGINGNISLAGNMNQASVMVMADNIGIASNGVGGISSSGTALVTGWPDALRCTNNTDVSSPKQYSIFIIGGNYSNGDDRIFYHLPSSTTDFYVIFNSNGTYSTHSNGAAYTDCLSKSISQLYTDGQAFNFSASDTSAGGTSGLSAYEAKVFNTNYQAQTDGFVVAWGASGQIAGYTDASTNPTTKRIDSEANTTNAARPALTFPVRKNEYWRVSILAGGGGGIWWVPLTGSNGTSATATTSGYLTAADWLNFNTKLSTLDLGSVSATGILSPLRLPAHTGDVTSVSGSAVLTLSNSGVVSGTYDRVTVDAKGRVTSATQTSLAQAYVTTNTNVNTGTGWNKLVYNAVEFDTDNSFNLTNGRFIPNRAGYYRITMFNTWSMIGTAGFTLSQALFKNGVQHKTTGHLIDYTSSFTQSLETSAIVYMNGTSDYIEGFASHNSGNNAFIYGGAGASWITTEFIRGP